MAQRLPPELEQLAIKYQQLEAQLASVVTQKSAILSQIKEIERALSVLQSVGDDVAVYRNTGFVMVKVSKEEAVRDLENRKEELQIRLTSLEKMESMLKKQLDEVKEKISKFRVGVNVGEKES
ncbi:MAG: prefoldin subunit beta [Desulfurococcales archaeon]|nr:prefoldin subunit beta [Desulfurococcales archaeon]